MKNINLKGQNYQYPEDYDQYWGVAVTQFAEATAEAINEDSERLEVLEGAVETISEGGGASYYKGQPGSYSITAKRCNLNQNILAGQSYSSIAVDSTAAMPTEPTGYLVFNFGNSATEEAFVPYLGKTADSILVDVSYVFEKTHGMGDIINIMYVQE